MRISALLRRAQDNPQQIKTLLTNVNYLWKELGNTLSPTSSRSVLPQREFGHGDNPEIEKALAELQKKLKDTYHAAYEAMKQLAALKA